MISSARIHLYLTLFLHRDYFFRPDSPYLALLCCRDYFFCSDSSPACFFVLQGLFLLLRCIPSLLFCAAGMISSAQMHPQLAFFFRRDYFFRPDSSLSCSVPPQGLLLPPGFIPRLLFCAAGMISSAQMHPQLTFLCCRDYFFCSDASPACFFHHRDYFFRPDSSPACSFLPQGLFPPPGFIPSLLFFSAGITSSAQIHLYLALLCCRDYFFCSDASPACFFLPQGLFLPLRCISILLFRAAGMISSAQIHPQLAFLCHRDDFCCADSSLSCSFSPRGLFLPPGFIPRLLFSSAGITSAARIHPKLALFHHRDYFDRSDSSLSCSFSPRGLFLPPGFIPILLFFSAGMISSAQMHLYLALFHHRDYFRRPASSQACFFHHRDYCDRPASSPACSFSPQGLFPPPGFIPSLLFCAAGMISAARIHPYLALFLRRDYF